LKIKQSRPLAQDLKSLVVMGNAKVNREVALFDLPPKKTCLNCKDCYPYCYAAAIEKPYPWVAYYRQLRFERSQASGIIFINEMVQTLKGVKYCRPHSAGDFYSQEYLDKWTEIIRQLPETKFFTFTKVDQLLDFRSIRKLPNVNIMSSIMPDGGRNFDLPLMVEIMQSKYKYPVCRAPRPYRQGYCMGECKICLTAEKVIFIQHGRSRNK
jgi:ferredoxin